MQTSHIYKSYKILPSYRFIYNIFHQIAFHMEIPMQPYQHYCVFYISNLNVLSTFLKSYFIACLECLSIHTNNIKRYGNNLYICYTH